MKHEMLKSLKQRYADAECNKIFTISIILDPMFKEKYFSCLDVVEELIFSLKDKVVEPQARQSKGSSIDETEELTRKHPKTTLLQCFLKYLKKQEHQLMI